jgi:hypothetical protein
VEVATGVDVATGVAVAVAVAVAVGVAVGTGKVPAESVAVKTSRSSGTIARTALPRADEVLMQSLPFRIYVNRMEKE